jgi:hypothetical protein
MGVARFCKVLFEENVGFWVLVWRNWALLYSRWIPAALQGLKGLTYSLSSLPLKGTGTYAKNKQQSLFAVTPA